MKRTIIALAFSISLLAAGSAVYSHTTTTKAGDGPGPFCPPICSLPDGGK